ncbi:MAG: hypothetical protein EBX52_06120 [Proteobacteria bacterium]|nr:hypothetical protein [Pseudomonadota bacterium]
MDELTLDRGIDPVRPYLQEPRGEKSSRGFYFRVLKKANLLCFFPKNSFDVLASTPQSFSRKNLRIFTFLNTRWVSVLITL